MGNRNCNVLALPVAAAIGWLWGISIDPRPLALIGLIPVLWTLVSNRWLAGLVPALYVLAATRGLIGGSMAFFDRSALFGVILWLVAAVPALHCRGTVLAATTKRRGFSSGIPLLVSGVGFAAGDAGRLGASAACRWTVVATTAPRLAVFAGNAGADEHRELDVVSAPHRTLHLPPARRRECHRPL